MRGVAAGEPAPDRAGPTDCTDHTMHTGHTGHTGHTDRTAHSGHIDHADRTAQLQGGLDDAVARSRAWAAFARLFEYPDSATIGRVRSGAVAEEIAAVLAAVDGAAPDREALGDAGAGDALAIEYTRLFDAGGTAPCPLYGGAYGGARMNTMEEAVRFYDHFGLTLAEAPRELPDHLATELEFLHFLAFREAEALAEGGDPGPWRRAQRDFIARHPGRWVPELRRRLARAQSMRFFVEAAARLEALLMDTSQRFARTVGSPSRG